MISAENIPHLRMYRNRVELPYDKRNQLRSSVAFMITNDTDALIKMTQNHMVRYNRHQYYFVPNFYDRRIFNKRIIHRLNAQRMELNRKVSSATQLRTNMSMDSINDKNVLVDVSIWNKLFFKEISRAKNYIHRCEEYFAILKDLVNDKDYSSHQIKSIIIDLDAIGKTQANAYGNINYLDNPLMLFYYAMFKKVSLVKELGKVNVFFISESGMLRVDPTMIDESSFRVFRVEINKINKLMPDSDSEIEKSVVRDEVVKNTATTIKQQYNFTGDDEDEEVIAEEIEKAASDEVDNELEKDETISSEELESKVQDKLSNDENLLKTIAKEISRKNTGTNASTKRSQLIRENQGSVKVGDETIDDLVKLRNSRDAKIEVNNVSDKVATTNSNVTTIRFANFDKAYIDNLYKKDLINSILKLNDAEIPVFVRNVTVEDTSTEMSFKETYTVELEDDNRVRHTLKFDMPKFVDGKFLYLNGNRKVINKQLFLKPIIKIEEDTVQIVSNYNKIFVRRHGSKLSTKTEKFRKALTNPVRGVNVKLGNNIKANTKQKTTIEYDELSKSFTLIKVGGTEIHFNQEKALQVAGNLGIKVPDDKLLVGFVDRKNPIFIDHKSQMIDGKDLVEYIVELMPQEVKDAYGVATTGKRFMYSQATIMARDVPLVLLLAYCIGLDKLLSRAEIKHYFTDKRPRLGDDEGFVEFADGFLVYEKYPFENSLLMNAFTGIPTKGFTYDQMNSREAYVLLFDTMYNQRNIATAFNNFYDFMIDPITKEILEELNYPTDFVGVVLFANKLLADNEYNNENDMGLYRVRSSELVNVYLYKAITSAYGEYRRTAYNNNPKKISIRKDAILKECLMAQTVEDYSTLNPINYTVA